MEYIATEIKQVGVRCNAFIKMWTFGEGLVDRWKSGKSSIDKAVAVCRKTRPCADL